jgi:hypothetical protein
VKDREKRKKVGKKRVFCGKYVPKTHRKGWGWVK